MLHELTHPRVVHVPPTGDAQYGRKVVTNMTDITEALQNADFYTFYAEDLCLASPTCAHNICSSGGCWGNSVSLGIYPLLF